MALANRTAEQRLALANSLDKCAALVRNNIEHRPVNYPTDVAAALAALKVLLDATITA